MSYLPFARDLAALIGLMITLYGWTILGYALGL